jgi:hypothetical protein
MSPCLHYGITCTQQNQRAEGGGGMFGPYHPVAHEDEEDEVEEDEDDSEDSLADNLPFLVTVFVGLYGIFNHFDVVDTIEEHGTTVTKQHLHWSEHQDREAAAFQNDLPNVLQQHGVRTF